MSETGSTIAVTHNFEAAHRLFLTPGKCENIHGHSFIAGIELEGPLDERGMVCGLDFGDVKRTFREYIDAFFDHRILLNREDPWAGDISYDGETLLNLPGVAPQPGDPTTENLALWIGSWTVDHFKGLGVGAVVCVINETRVNAASWSWYA
jgi:6-pyruvoyltetrahydropterin/6-carboxytetrahydropterin synthase